MKMKQKMEMQKMVVKVMKVECSAFKWFTLPAIKTAGGILLGVKEDVFDVISVSYGPSHISFILRDKSDAFVWNLIASFGTAYADQKLDLFTEFHELLGNNFFPILL
jgi:hypothetical protein